MRERRSVRSYKGLALNDYQRQMLTQAVEESWSPFGGRLTIRLKHFGLEAGCRPGTYGMIKGAGDFFLLGMGADEASALTAGFRFEQVVLRAWQLGLGTCWIAATFRGSDFARGETWPDGEELRIVCPVGVAAAPTTLERITRFTLGSRKRKPFGELFYDGDFGHPLSPDSRFGEALEMVRLAPSSTNSQPWRALVCGDSVHFYYKPKSEASLVDCGIGMCHFLETERFRGRSGSFVRDDAAPEAPSGCRYLMTYKAE